MAEKAIERLKISGFVETTVTQVFGLSPEEEQMVEVQVAAARIPAPLRELRVTLPPTLSESEARLLLGSLPEPEKLPMDVKRQLFVDFASRLGDRLDARGVSEDEILREFTEFRNRRRGR